MRSGRWSLILVRQRRSGNPIKSSYVIRETLNLRASGVEPLRLPVTRLATADISLHLRPRERTARQCFSADLVLPRRNGKTLLFDFAREEVLIHAPGKFDARYRSRRDAFARHVSSVAYRTLDDDSIVESMLRGGSILQAERRVAFLAVSDILDQLPGLCAESGRSPAGSPWVQVGGWGDIGELSGPEEWLASAPLVPAHGDLGPSNVILTARGPTCIDFDDVAVAPAWMDPFRLTFLTLMMHGWPHRSVETAGLLVALERFLRRVLSDPLPEAWVESAYRAVEPSIARSALPASRTWVG